MNERLLQFIWQFQYFNTTSLQTDTDEEIQIIYPGQYNTDQGPDFSEARIRIGQTVWAGNIELHVRTSDWNKHHHNNDVNYRNVILHVVWENDESKNNIPVLELKNRVSKILLRRYEELMYSSSFIACGKNSNTLPLITWTNWKERLLAERLSRKSKSAEACLTENNYHWEETFWWLLARNFGIKINSYVFEAVARSVSLNLLGRHRNNLHQLEALLLGQAGLLDDEFKEEYPLLLQSEYQFYQHKYKLERVHMRPLFLRMRPGSFPTIRLAQLAMLIYKSIHLFAEIKETSSLKNVKDILLVTASDYWNDHYIPREVSVFQKKQLGGPMIDNIIINTIIPLLFVYGNYYDQHSYTEKVMKWLGEMKTENNTIIHQFEQLGIGSKTAFDSQALIELKNEYCDKKRCLECAIGNFLLKRI